MNKENVFIDFEGSSQAITFWLPEMINTPQESKEFAVQEALHVQETGCYMRDYVIDGNGHIIQTRIQHVIDGVSNRR